MLSGCLIVAGLVAVPSVDVQAGLSTQASAGVTPVVPGAPPTESMSAQVRPDLGIVFQETGVSVALTYAPRIFYRGFLGDVDVEPLNRPLFLHEVGLAYSQVLAKSWRLGLSASMEAGEVDFQAATATFTSPTGQDNQPTGAGGQSPNAQAITALTVSGGLSLEADLGRRTQWATTVGGTYTRPLGDVEVQTDDFGNPITEVAQLPEALGIEVLSAISYRMSRQHSFNFGLTGSYNTFDAVTAAEMGMAATSQSQTFQSAGVSLGYGLNFGRSSAFNVDVGAQLATGQGQEADGTQTTLDPIPLPTAAIRLSWLPLNRRSVSLNNVLGVQVAGGIDPVFGTFQPRLTGVLSFEFGLPPDLSIGLIGTYSMPLAEPDTGQGVVVDAAAGAGDSQLDLELPITYRFTRYISGSIGARFSYFFTTFGLDATDMMMMDAAVLDSSLTAEGFISLTFTISTVRNAAGGPGRTGTGG